MSESIKELQPNTPVLRNYSDFDGMSDSMSPQNNSSPNQNPDNIFYNEESNYSGQNDTRKTPQMALSNNNIPKKTPIVQNIQILNTNYTSINISPNIVNIVSTANLNCELILKEIALQCKNAEYNQKTFSGLIMKLKEPKTTALIFSSGKIVCLGAKTEEISKQACRKFAKIIKSLGYKVALKDFKIQNIVGSANVGFQTSLIKLYSNLYKKINGKKSYFSYEPEQFPGLIYEMAEPRIILLIFSSGKLVLTGGKKVNDIFEGFKKIYPLLLRCKSSNMIHQENIKQMKELKMNNNF